MGAGASVDAESLLTKDEAVALAGEQWDEAKWEAAEKDEEGKVKAGVVLAAAPAPEAVPAAAEAAAEAPEAPAEAPADAPAAEAPAEALAAEAPSEPEAPGGPDGSAMPAEAAEAAVEEAPRASTVEEMQFHAKALHTSDNYVFGDPDSKVVEVEGLEHLSAGGFAAGTTVTQMETPNEIHGAEMIFFKLAQFLLAKGDTKSSGFGTRYRPVTVNYYRMFKALDVDCDKLIEIDEFEKTIRRVLGITKAQVTEAELAIVFTAMDVDGNKQVSIKEFAAFAKGAQPASAYRGELTYHKSDAASSAGSTRIGGTLDQDFTSLDDNKAEAQALQSVPHLSDRASVSNGVAAERVDHAPKDLDKPHLVLWHIAQYVGAETDSNQTSGMVFHPGHISYPRLFKKLDLDMDKGITRDEWAISLRRHIGIGTAITDDDLNTIFDAMDEDGNNQINLREFCGYARGSSSCCHARGLAHSIQQKKEGGGEAQAE